MAVKSLQRIDLDEVVEFLDGCGENTRVYIGCDSENLGGIVQYTTVICVHINGAHGCKIFGEVETEPSFDWFTGRPNMRLLREAYRAGSLYGRLVERVHYPVDMEVHLDLSPSPGNASHSVVSEAVGYVRALCDVTPKIKPEAFAATYAADRYKIAS